MDFSKFPRSKEEPWIRIIPKGTQLYKGGITKQNDDYNLPSWFSDKDIADKYTKTGQQLVEFKTMRIMHLVDIQLYEFHNMLKMLLTKHLKKQKHSKHSVLLDSMWKSTIQFDMTIEEQYKIIKNGTHLNKYKPHTIGKIKKQYNDLINPVNNGTKCECPKGIKTQPDFFPLRYSEFTFDKQLVKVLLYLFGHVYDGYVAGDWLTVYPTDIGCFHQEICIFKPTECVQHTQIMQHGGTNKMCTLKNIKIYHFIKSDILEIDIINERGISKDEFKLLLKQ